MTGYAANKLSDTYRVYNPLARKIVERRDIVWMDWERNKTGHTMDIFQDKQCNVPTGERKERREDMVRIKLTPDITVGRNVQPAGRLTGPAPIPLRVIGPTFATVPPSTPTQETITPTTTPESKSVGPTTRSKTAESRKIQS